ncbi:MAG: class I tRNA ligase family protein, partial [Proteobacteria bacterium]|nr:class I tRNA ligase family protein [Pseudomonadota bacterium]
LIGQDSQEYFKSNDILDVWFDSGVSHFCVLMQRSELGVPADLYFEGSDQHRGWFQTSLLTAVAMRGKAPYRTVLTHGYVVDSQGYKMSKSLGNVVVPIEVAKNLGADILRLWVAGADYKLDINYSEEILKRTVDAYRRIRNTIRFLLANIFDFNPGKDLLPGEKLLALDRWAISQTIALQQEVMAAYSDYSFQTVYQKIHNFCSVQMGSFYLDIIKDRQYTSYRTGIPRRSAQTAMYHILESLVRCLAPMISFTAEEIWRYIPGERCESVFLSVWYDRFPFFKTGLQIDWSLLIPVRDAINKLLEQHRRNGNIGSALDTEVILYAEDKLFSELSHLGDELRFVLITSSAQALPLNQAPADAETTEIPSLLAKIVVSDNQKCVRCWQRRPDIGKNSEHPGLCGRCVENLEAPGETRRYV